MSNNLQHQNIAILGASRGLGFELAQELCRDSSVNLVIAVSRNVASLQGLEIEWPQLCPLTFDLTCKESLGELWARLLENSVTSIIYVAGGGPYGDFKSKEWKDHQWALDLNFLTPAQLVYKALHEGLVQFIYVGSAICEGHGDPGAASYCAAKNGMLGLYQSMALEKAPLDFRIYSPGYMDTPLLPPNARSRHDGSNLLSPKDVAKDLWSWAKSADPKGRRLFK